LNNITRSIFRAIHEGRWLSIEYKNQQTQLQANYQMIAQAYQLTAEETKALFDAITMMKPIAWASMFMITDLVAGAVLSPILAAIYSKKRISQQ
jgi:hypothetical protein